MCVGTTGYSWSWLIASAFWKVSVLGLKLRFGRCGVPLAYDSLFVVSVCYCFGVFFSLSVEFFVCHLSLFLFWLFFR